MNASLDVTITLDRYDRHFPFFDGTVKPPAGIELNARQVGQSAPARDGLDRQPTLRELERDGGRKGADRQQQGGDQGSSHVPRLSPRGMRNLGERTPQSGRGDPPGAGVEQRQLISLHRCGSLTAARWGEATRVHGGGECRLGTVAAMLAA